MKIIKIVLASLGLCMLVFTIYRIIEQAPTLLRNITAVTIIVKAMVTWPLIFSELLHISESSHKSNALLFCQLFIYTLTIILSAIVAAKKNRNRFNWLLLAIAFPHFAPLSLSLLRKKSVDHYQGIIGSMLFIYAGMTVVALGGNYLFHAITVFGYMSLCSATNKLLHARIVRIFAIVSSALLGYCTMFKIYHHFPQFGGPGVFQHIIRTIIQWPAVLIDTVIDFSAIPQLSIWWRLSIALYLLNFFIVYRLAANQKRASFTWFGANVALPFAIPIVLAFLPQKQEQQKTGTFAIGMILIWISVYAYMMTTIPYTLLLGIIGGSLIIVHFLTYLNLTVLRASTAASGAIILTYSIIDFINIFRNFTRIEIQNVLILFNYPVTIVMQILHIDSFFGLPAKDKLVTAMLSISLLFTVALAHKLRRSAWNWGYCSFFLPYISANILPYIKKREKEFYNRPLFFMLMLTGVLFAVTFHLSWFYFLAGVGFLGMVAAGPRSESKSSGTSSSHSSYYGAGSYSSYSLKSCSNCGRSVPSSSHAGQRCPHCGVYWSTENRRMY